MTHAELLRKHATDATNEGGIWFSGEYMDMLAKVAESLEAENAKLRDENAELRKLGGFMLRCMMRNCDCDYCLANGEHCEISYIEGDALELGIEVDW